MSKRLKDQCLMVIKVNKQCCSIRATFHALERMEQRAVSSETVKAVILSLEQQGKLSKLLDEKKKTMIIDKINKVTVVLDFKQNVIKIVTVINDINVFIKDNQKIERII